MSEIIQCPKKCGRLVRVVGSLTVNAAGIWKDKPHSCVFDGADVRGDNDDDVTREEELDELNSEYYSPLQDDPEYGDR